MQPNGNVIVDTICRTAKLGTTITGATENGDVTVIEAEPVEPINECPTCGQPGVFRDHVIRSLVDLPIVGHPTTSCAPSTLPVHQQALLAEDLPCWPCLRARQFKDHGPGDPLDPATTLPKSDERCRCTQVIRPGVGYEVSQVLFRLMKPVFETTYGAQRTPMPKLPQHRLPHQTHDSGIHTLNPHACKLFARVSEHKGRPAPRGGWVRAVRITRSRGANRGRPHCISGPCNTKYDTLFFSRQDLEQIFLSCASAHLRTRLPQAGLPCSRRFTRFKGGKESGAF